MPNLVLFFGDSQFSQDYSDGTSFFAAKLNEGTDYHTISVGGSTFAQWIATYCPDQAAWNALVLGYDGICVVTDLGTNDLNAGASGADTYTATCDFSDLVKARGLAAPTPKAVSYFQLAVTQRTGSAGVSDRIAAFIAACDADASNKLDGLPRIDSVFVNVATHTTDNLHWNAAFALVAAPVAASPINTLFPASRVWTQTFADAFNRANGNVGNGWGGNVDTNFQISGNKIVPVGNSYDSQKAVAPSGVLTGQRLELKCTLDGDVRGSMYEVRMQASGINGYASAIYNGNFRMYELASGSASPYGSAASPLGLIASTQYRVQMDAVGDKVSTKFSLQSDPNNWIAKVCFTDATYADGTCCLASFFGADAIDDVSIWTPADIVAASGGGFIGGGYGGHILGG